MNSEKIRKGVAIASTLAILALTGLALVAKATTVEGYTPAGNFQTVFVSATGRLYVEQSSGVLTHVVVDSGTIDVGNTVAVTGPASAPVAVSGNLTATVSASTGATITTGQFNLNPVAIQVFAASTVRQQSLLCNNDAVMNAFVGPSGVSVNNGLQLPPGTCFSPDVPSSFQGALFVVSTGIGGGNDFSYMWVSP